MKSASSSAVIDLIVKTLFDKKAINIIAIDVKSICTLTDFFIIAEATVDTHARALASAVIEVMKKASLPPLHIEGMQTGDWIVVDCAEVVVHILLPEMRQKYKLEQLWQAGHVVETGVN